MKVKISLRFVSWLEILDIAHCTIPYILFKLEEIKKSGPYLCENIPFGCLGTDGSHSFALYTSNLLVS